MSPHRLESDDDPRLAPFRDLPRNRPTSLDGRFIAEGRLPVERVFESDYVVEALLCEERLADEYLSRVGPEAAVFVASRALCERIVGFHFHRGVLACVRRKPTASLAAVAGERGAPRLAAIGVGVQDPENLGALFRNAAAFGAAGVLLGNRCADPFSRRVLRVSMGAVLKLAVRETEDLPADLRALRAEHGFSLLATVLDASATPLAEARLPRRAALLVGNERHGLPPEAVALCDRRLTLPMDRGVDSLNVSVATAIFLYHLTRVAPPET